MRTFGTILLSGSIVVLILLTLAFSERVGSPVAWGEQKWEAFKANDDAGQDQSRFLSASGSGRYVLWEVAWKDFVSHPLLGVGTHNFEATYYQLRGPAVFHARQPHMLPLEVLGERGLVGGVLFFGFLGTCLAAGFARRFGNLNAEGRAQIGALMAAITYWFVHSSAEWFWQIPAVTLPAIVFLALLVAPWERRRGYPSPWPMRVVGMGIGMLAIVAVTPLYVADNYLAQADAAANVESGLKSVELAQKFNPVDPDLPEREAEMAVATGDWSRAQESYARAVELDPQNYAPYYLAALLYERRGKPDNALPLYRKASSLNPRDEEIERRLERLEAVSASQGRAPSD